MRRQNTPPNLCVADPFVKGCEGKLRNHQQDRDPVQGNGECLVSRANWVVCLRCSVRHGCLRSWFQGEDVGIGALIPSCGERSRTPGNWGVDSSVVAQVRAPHSLPSPMTAAVSKPSV